jgi:hypothetical protein
MKSILLIGIVVISLFFSCSERCGDSVNLPGNILIEIVDLNTNENVFINGAYNESQLTISVNPPNANTNFKLITENNLNVISISPILTSGTFVTTLNLNNEFYIPIETKTEKVETNCSTNYIFSSFKVIGFDWEQNTETGIIKIKI